ncbi:hypothetical protein VP01_2892g2 [Puccinia sorghi]|uniref:Uncharacterized protein n=1 Tax=Puccinia sorghi TaxID=27349 RepID=A0A0L6V1M0_9BASI|nr:hypothetical protein VP01_2892g2 [Puccinia sorghi]
MKAGSGGEGSCGCVDAESCILSDHQSILKRGEAVKGIVYLKMKSKVPKNIRRRTLSFTTDNFSFHNVPWRRNIQIRCLLWECPKACTPLLRKVGIVFDILPSNPRVWFLFQGRLEEVFLLSCLGSPRGNVIVIGSLESYKHSPCTLFRMVIVLILIGVGGWRSDKQDANWGLLGIRFFHRPKRFDSNFELQGSKHGQHTSWVKSYLHFILQHQSLSNINLVCLIFCVIDYFLDALRNSFEGLLSSLCKTRLKSSHHLLQEGFTKRTREIFLHSVIYLTLEFSMHISPGHKQRQNAMCAHTFILGLVILERSQRNLSTNYQRKGSKTLSKYPNISPYRIKLINCYKTHTKYLCGKSGKPISHGFLIFFQIIYLSWNTFNGYELYGCSDTIESFADWNIWLFEKKKKKAVDLFQQSTQDNGDTFIYGFQGNEMMLDANCI